MAFRNTQRTPIIVSRDNVPFPVSSNIERWIHVYSSDIENISKNFNLPDFAGREYDEQRDIAARHYDRRRHELDLMARGQIKFVKTEDVYTFTRCTSDTIRESVNTPRVKVNFYGYSWFLREIKHCLQTCLDLPALPHGYATQDCGILVFTVDNCTKEEAQRTYAQAKEYGFFYDMYIPDPTPATSRVGGKVTSRKVALRAINRSNVSLLPHTEDIVSRETSEPVTRPANAQEMDILANALALLNGDDTSEVMPVEAIDLDELIQP